MHEIVISQSSLKMLVDYMNEKACGLLFKARYVDGDPESWGEPSEAMKAGIYFEFLCTGALPKNGGVPQAEKTAKGLLKEAYKRATDSALLFRKTIAHYGIEIISKGETIEARTPAGVLLRGVLDIRAKWKGEEVLIDLKYSGLLHDKWNELGWELESLPMKDSIMVQGVHYKTIERLAGRHPDIPFYYFVFNSQDETDARIIEQVVDESRMAQHELAVLQAKQTIESAIKKGFKAYPDLSRCASCPIAHKCDKKVVVPKIYQVYY